MIRQARKFAFLDYIDGGPKFSPNFDAHNIYFDFAYDKWEYSVGKPELILLNQRFMSGCYDPDMIEKVHKELEKFPNAIILFEFVSGPTNYVNTIEVTIKEKPKFLNNRKWAILHYSQVRTPPSWLEPRNLIYYDLRFDQYRYFTVMHSPLRNLWEHKALLWKKPDIYDISKKTRPLLIINRVKPKDFQTGARFYLDELCERINSKIFCGNQKHVLNSSISSVDALKWYEEQSSSNRLIGCLEDPTVDNFQSWSPVSGLNQRDTTTYNRYINDWNNHPHSWYYENTFCSVYVETTETHDALPSEKTWAPLCRGHFIVPFNGINFINLLKNLGFEFPNFIDYSYDKIENDNDRVTAWLSEVERLSNLSLVEWRKLTAKNLDIIEHNIKNFYFYPRTDPYRQLFEDTYWQDPC